MPTLAYCQPPYQPRRCAGAYSTTSAADGHALSDPEHDQEHRRQPPDARACRQDADACRRDRHQQDPGGQRATAAVSVAVVAEQQCARRSGEECDTEDAEGRFQAPGRARRAEVHAGDDRRERTLQREVVPLDQIADATGDERPPTIAG
jgi:hypothetical protein